LAAAVASLACLPVENLSANSQYAVKIVKEKTQPPKAGGWFLSSHVDVISGGFR
jgi:hypothetical protein